MDPDPIVYQSQTNNLDLLHNLSLHYTYTFLMFVYTHPDYPLIQQQDHHNG